MQSCSCLQGRKVVSRPCKNFKSSETPSRVVPAQTSLSGEGDCLQKLILGLNGDLRSGQAGSGADAATAHPFCSLRSRHPKTTHSVSSLFPGLSADMWGCPQHFTQGKCLDTTLIEGTASPALSLSSGLTHCKCTLSAQNSEALDDMPGFVTSSSAGWYVHI